MALDIFVLVEHLRGEVEEITYVCAAAGKHIADAAGGEVVAILLGHNAADLVKDLLVSKILYVDDPALADFTPEAYLKVLGVIMEEHRPGYFICGHTSVGMDVVCGLGVKLNLPVISQCQKVSPNGGKALFHSQICGGKIIAEGDIPEDGALISMILGGYNAEEGMSGSPPPVETIAIPRLAELKIKLTDYIEPDLSDVDISKEEILLAVGRGLKNQGDLELVEVIARKIGGTICASRPIIDQGWLAASRLVGKSGKKVAPKVYLALGISGAPEHIQGMSESDLIIAVNTDPNAPIFDVARYGIETDMIDMLEALNEKLP
jgi:electron transfer flavoprotein alpha subunit